MKEKWNPVMLESKEQPKKDAGLTTGVNILFCGFILAGITGLFAALSSFESGRWIFMGMAWFTCGVFLISRKWKVAGGVVPVAFLCVILFLFLFHTLAVIRGGLSILNDILDRWNQEYYTYKTLFSVSGVTRGEIWMAAIVLGILCGLFLGYTVWYRWMLFLSLGLVLGIALSFSLNLNEGIIAEILLCAGWIGLWSESFISSESRWRMNIFLGLSVVILGVMGIFLLQNYREVKVISSVEKKMEETIHRLRYGEDSLPKGDLKKASYLLGKGEEEKTLKLSFGKIEEMYLRGYVGSSYAGNTWQQLSSKAYQGRQEGMLNWLQDQDYISEFSYASACNLEKKYGSGENLLLKEMEKEDFSVLNNGADRQYIYVPSTVETVSGAGYRMNQDWQLKARGMTGAREYDFKAYVGGRPTEILTQPQWLFEKTGDEIQTYQQCEAVYRNFVNENYLQIGEKQKEIINRLFFSGTSWNKDWNFGQETEGIYSATSRIRVVLDILAEYEENPPELPEGEDFVSWFLEDSKKGNAVHFATTAVLAYRALGIPARYAEGYYVSQEQADQLTAKKANQVQLTEENSHAWVEIYVGGIGWCPVEVTPGFYHELYSPNEIIAVPEEEIESGTKKQQVDVDETFRIEDKKEKEKKTPYVPWRIAGIILLFLFVGMGIFFILEIQRLLRCWWAMYKLKKEDGESEARYYYERISLIFLLAGIQHSLRYPYEVTKTVTEVFKAVKKEEYERVVKIEQQTIFGQKELKNNERRVLREFYHKICGILYEESSVWKKLYYRYVKCI